MTGSNRFWYDGKNIAIEGDGGGGGQPIELKTINGESIKGSGNIDTTPALKTINGQTLLGSGNIVVGGGGGGTTNYNDLSNKPSINNVTLSGNKSLADLGIVIPSIDGCEKTANRVTSISASSTDTKYPTAKAVYSYVNGIVGDIESALDVIIGGGA